MQIAPNVYRISGPVGNQFLITEPNELTLIDAGLPGNEKKIIQTILKLGRKPEELKRILITHADADHYGALNALKHLTPAKSYASQVEANAIRIGKSSRELHPTGMMVVFFRIAGSLMKKEPAEIDGILTPGEILPVLEGLEVLNTKGHTPGHTSFFLRERKILFAGDSIKGTPPAPSSGGNNWDVDKSISSFKMQMELSPVIIGAGHNFYTFKKP
jgi:glyoxylase-like metal-dependent hydrolase (beta-lactamase superfamily II)